MRLAQLLIFAVQALPRNRSLFDSTGLVESGKGIFAFLCRYAYRRSKSLPNYFPLSVCFYTPMCQEINRPIRDRLELSLVPLCVAISFDAVGKQDPDRIVTFTLLINIHSKPCCSIYQRPALPFFRSSIRFVSVEATYFSLIQSVLITYHLSSQELDEGLIRRLHLLDVLLLTSPVVQAPPQSTRFAFLRASS